MKSTRQFTCEIKLQQHLEKQRDLALNRIKKYFDSGKEMDTLEYAELIYIKNFYENEIVKIKNQIRNK